VPATDRNLAGDQQRALVVAVVDGFAVGQVVEAAAQRLAVKGDRAQRPWRAACAQVAGMAAEGGFEIVRAERQEQITQVFTAGARRKPALKTAFRRSRCRAMNAMIFL